MGEIEEVKGKLERKEVEEVSGAAPSNPFVDASPDMFQHGGHLSEKARWEIYEDISNYFRRLVGEDEVVNPARSPEDDALFREEVHAELEKALARMKAEGK